MCSRWRRATCRCRARSISDCRPPRAAWITQPALTAVIRFTARGACSLPSFYGFSRTMSDARAADDVMQDAYMRIADGLCADRKIQKPLGYCCQVVRNLALDTTGPTNCWDGRLGGTGGHGGLTAGAGGRAGGLPGVGGHLCAGHGSRRDGLDGLADWRTDYAQFLNNIAEGAILISGGIQTLSDPFGAETPLVQETAAMLSTGALRLSARYGAASAPEIVRLFVASRSLQWPHCAPATDLCYP